jgi:hypothetical protein
MASRVYRNKKIGEFIRSGEVACCITGSTYAVVNHHIIGHGYSGTGTKAPDFLQMAMTHTLHDEIHRHGWKVFEDKYEICQKVMVTETALALHAHGVIDTNKLDMPEWFHELKDFFND